MIVNELDKQIVKELQNGLPLVSRSFQVLAQRCGITEDEFLARVHAQNQRFGILRRIGATLRQRQVGFTANAMIVWQIPEDRIEDTGRRMAQLPEVTHCYQRAALPHWPYNIYTMVYGHNRAECQKIAVKLAEISGVSTYQLLYSVAELKRSSMKYFMD